VRFLRLGKPSRKGSVGTTRLPLTVTWPGEAAETVRFRDVRHGFRPNLIVEVWRVRVGVPSADSAACPE
jgi:hypothetical protein